MKEKTLKQQHITAVSNLHKAHEKYIKISTAYEKALEEYHAAKDELKRIELLFSDNKNVVISVPSKENSEVVEFHQQVIYNKTPSAQDFYNSLA